MRSAKREARWWVKGDCARDREAEFGSRLQLVEPTPCNTSADVDKRIDELNPTCRVPTEPTEIGEPRGGAGLGSQGSAREGRNCGLQSCGSLRECRHGPGGATREDTLSEPAGLLIEKGMARPRADTSRHSTAQGVVDDAGATGIAKRSHARRADGGLLGLIGGKGPWRGHNQDVIARGHGESSSSRVARRSGRCVERTRRRRSSHNRDPAAWWARECARKLHPTQPAAHSANCCAVLCCGLALFDCLNPSAGAVGQSPQATPRPRPRSLLQGHAYPVTGPGDGTLLTTHNIPSPITPDDRTLALVFLNLHLATKF